MRLLMLSGTFQEKADGVARTMQRLSQTLSQAQITHHVYAPLLDDFQQPYLHTQQVRSLPFPGYRDYRISLPGKQLWQQWDALQPDIVHIATPDWLGWCGLRYAEKRQLPVVAAYHTHFPSYLAYYHLNWLQPWLWRYLRNFYQRCNVILVPSPSLMRELEAHDVGSTAPQAKSTLRLWSRGMDLSLFNPQRRDQQLRQEWGGDDYFYVAFAGRLVWYKELELVAKVIEQQSASSRCRFLFIGDGPAAPALQRRLPQAQFLGHVSKAKMGAMLASANVLLFPSRSETFGQVVLEAMSCGIPQLVADVGGPADLVRQAQSGLVLPAGDAAAFAQGLQQMQGDAALYQKLRQQGIAFAQQQDWDLVNQVVVQTYRELLASQGDITRSR